MNLCRAISALMLVCLLPHGVAAQEEPPTPPSSAAGACTIVGPVLGPTDFGVAAGLPLADASAVLLEDGRVRMYMFAQDRGIVSAVSLTAEGVAFVAEEGERLPDGAGMPRVVAAPTGGLRLFYISGDGIMSATSEDGLTFTVEPGFRITAEEAGFSGATAGGAASGATVVQLADGRYRMYFSDLPRPGDPPGGHWVKSAVSDDQLVWTVEEGVRLGPDAPVLTESSEHPFVLANPDGSVTLYYGKFPGPGSASEEGLYESTSVDGLTFEEETYDVFFANDPDALRLVDGSLVVYYGQFDPLVGGTINVARCPDPGEITSPAPPRSRGGGLKVNRSNSLRRGTSPAPPGAAPTPLTVTVVGRVGSGAFTPNPLPVAVGDTVIFNNSDSTTHHLVLDDAASTEIGTLGPGQSSGPISMTSAGVAYHCTIHPSMVGSLGTVDIPPPPSAPPPDDDDEDPDDDYDDDYE